MKTKRYYVDKEDQSIMKRDIADNWYVFRHGKWENSSPVKEHIEELGKPMTLGSARKGALKCWVEEFKKFHSEAMPEGFNEKNIYYSKGDEDAPFWSEGFLYPLLGKEDARSVLARLRRLDDISKAY